LLREIGRDVDDVDADRCVWIAARDTARLATEDLAVWFGLSFELSCQSIHDIRHDAAMCAGVNVSRRPQQYGPSFLTQSALD